MCVECCILFKIILCKSRKLHESALQSTHVCQRPTRQACDGQRGCRCAEHNANKHWLHSHVFQIAAAHAVDSDVLFLHHPLVTSCTDNATILGDVTKPGVALLYASSSVKNWHEKMKMTHTRLLLMN